MAKVEIEDRAFQDPDLRFAVSKYRVSAPVILGYAAVLWRHSQQAGLAEAPVDKIIGWLDVDRFSKPKKALAWLIAAGFLAPSEDENVLKIRGNAFRVERTQNRIQNAKEAARSRYQKKPLCDSHADGIADGNATRMPDRETIRQRDSKTDFHAVSSAEPTTEPVALKSHDPPATMLPKKEAANAPSPRDLVEVWNTECRGAMRRVKEIEPGTKRWNSAKARLAKEPDLELHRSRVKQLAASSFVRGEVPGRDGGKPWRGNFDWFIRPDTRLKFIEGVYSNDDKQVSKTPMFDESLDD